MALLEREPAAIDIGVVAREFLPPELARLALPQLEDPQQRAPRRGTERHVRGEPADDHEAAARGGFHDGTVGGIALARRPAEERSNRDRRDRVRGGSRIEA